ncbi:MAG: hypothetical protein E7559_10575 [Ruminococcaceae bacterium]|nr:hypothetical protein [Oscillospiraceae bacterium]
MSVSISYEYFRQLYAADELVGWQPEDIALLKERFGALPETLEQFYSAAALTPRMLAVQDEWVTPQHYRRWDWLWEDECLVILIENQGVCRAGVRREDLHLPDPPVYYRQNGEGDPWLPCAPSVSEFLASALAYEVIFTFEYTPEDFVYCIEKEALPLLDERLDRQGYTMSWLSGLDFSFYTNAANNMLVLMDYGESELQLLFGGTDEEACARLAAAVEDIAQPL